MHSSQLTYILIDEDDDDQLIFAEAVHELSYQLNFLSISTERELYSYFESGKVPALFFLDWNLHCKFEKNCLKQIKKQKHLENVPVIIYSDYNSPGEIEELYNSGAALFITKPASFRELTGILTVLLNIKWENFNPASHEYRYLTNFKSVKILK